jgi:NhaP-type Na+/H+ or K+/H+ antiporter
MAVLTYEAIKLNNLHFAFQHAAIAILVTLVVGLAVGLFAGWLLTQAIDRDWLPDHLHTVGALMVLVATFIVSNLRSTP